VRWAAPAVAVAAVTLGAGALAVNRFLVGVFYDDGLYAGLAVALVRGAGYVHPHLPGTPACIHYPPLYPLVLAPLFATLPPAGAGLAAKLLNLALAAGGAGLVAWHAVRADLLGTGAPRWLAPAVVAAAATAIPVLTTQSVLFSEPLFAVLLALAVICADRDRPLLAGSAAALALLTRTIGVAAGVGIALHLLRRRAPARTIVMALGPVGIAALGWGAWVVTHRTGIDPALALNYGSYAEVLRQTGVGALGTSALDLLRPLLGLTVGWIPWTPVRLALAVATVALGAYGLLKIGSRSAIGPVLLAYLAVLAIWPYPADRFLWAVLPWLALAWAAGVVAVAARPSLRAGTAIVAAVLVLGFGMYQVRGFSGRWWEGAARGVSANFEELLPALREMPAGVVLATDDEALVWLYTARTAVPLYLYAYRGATPVEPEPAEHRAYLERQGVTHVLLASASSASAGELRRLIGAYPDWLSPVRSWPGGRWLYQVRRDR
jgi:hypothetical protein